MQIRTFSGKRSLYCPVIFLLLHKDVTLTFRPPLLHLDQRVSASFKLICYFLFVNLHFYFQTDYIFSHIFFLAYFMRPF